MDPGHDGGERLEWLMSSIPARTTLADYLLQQAQLDLPPEEMPIATYLANNLDNRGFLCCEIEEVQDHFQVPGERVERVIAVLQGLEPAGIAARNLRECLLIQLNHLSSQGIGNPLAERLVSDHWKALGRCEMMEIARAARVTVTEVCEALQFIKQNLNPFPTQAAWSRSVAASWQEPASILYPSVIIRTRGVSGQESYEIELPEEERYRLRVNPAYVEEMKVLERNKSDGDRKWAEWEALYSRARWLIQGLEQRWETLRSIMRCLVDYQRGYLRFGDRHLRPLTRAELADRLGIHESTVSRAVADKSVQLPDGRIVPLAKFFDSTASVKAAISELIRGEKRPLSDRQIAERLARSGYDVSRRTVAKYRNALGIPASSARRRIETLQAVSGRCEREI
jgi:RNA polymerase sigma-54 factor